MTQYKLNPSQSGQATLQVVLDPIISFSTTTFPSSPQAPGTALSVTFTCTNSGGVKSAVPFVLYNGATQLGSTTINITSATPGYIYTGTINFTMPAADANLQLACSYAVGAPSAVIQAYLVVNTAISTLALSPAIVYAGGATVTFTATLSRADGGTTGIHSVPIELVNVESGLVVATTNTASNSGAFTGTFLAPSVQASYKYFARYNGSGFLASSVSPEAGIQVGEAGSFNPLWLIGGAALLYLLTKKKR